MKIIKVRSTSGQIRNTIDITSYELVVYQCYKLMDVNRWFRDLLGNEGQILLVRF